jgi:putative chitinase
MTTLKLGSSGPDVVALQDALRAHGHDAGASDGSFGPGTLAAVIAFQRSQGMVADGVVGPNTAAALGLTAAPLTTPIPGVTVDAVCQMFPSTPRANIERSLPSVLDGLVAASLSDKAMVLMALATIRAEVECFMPISEGQSKYNTSPGGEPFDLYDNRTSLGNGPGDGAKYRGRGFVQLTGKSNYELHGTKIGEDLVNNPDLANDPVIASKLLASFLKVHEAAIRSALTADDLKTARKLVNGGSNGLDRFEDAFRIGQGVIPDASSAATG